MSRASNLISAYKQTDKKYNYGKSNLTSRWIVDNIFSKSCVHCGCKDWRKLGCNRIDNTKPHTIDNVEPCCYKCNRKLPRPNAWKNKTIPHYNKLPFIEKLKRNIGIYNFITDAYVY